MMLFQPNNRTRFTCFKLGLLAFVCLLAGCGTPADTAPGATAKALSTATAVPVVTGEDTVSATAAPPSRTRAVHESTAGATPKDSDSSASVPPTRKPASAYADLEIVTLLPPDAIPAIDNPQFLTADEADAFYDADELVIGVAFDGEARAYSAPFLSNHEIVNDTVGGVKIAVTW